MIMDGYFVFFGSLFYHSACTNTAVSFKIGAVAIDIIFEKNFEKLQAHLKTSITRRSQT